MLAEEDLSETLKNYKTISLHGVQLYKNSGYDWSNIGGLENVKEVLKQLLKWPMQYPELYRNAPIKNQNGVLLYGMPGTGKTILAGAIAKECGVNLISVKVPFHIHNQTQKFNRKSHIFYADFRDLNYCQNTSVPVKKQFGMFSKSKYHKLPSVHHLIS